MASLDELYPEIYPLNTSRCLICKYQKLTMNELNIIKEKERNCEIIQMFYCTCDNKNTKNNLASQLVISFENGKDKIEVSKHCFENYPCRHTCNNKIMNCTDIYDLLTMNNITYDTCITDDQKKLYYHLKTGCMFTNPIRVASQ